MAKRKRRPQPPRCHRCGLLRFEWETFFRGLCDKCRAEVGAENRRQRGARVLAKAKDAGTLERDGQTFTVVVLPPKRRGGRRIG